MNYTAVVEREEVGFSITFPDAPGCATQCDREEDIVPTATEALEGWLEAHLATDQLPQRPVFENDGYAIVVSAALALTLEQLWAQCDEYPTERSTTSE